MSLKERFKNTLAKIKARYELISNARMRIGDGGFPFADAVAKLVVGYPWLFVSSLVEIGLGATKEGLVTLEEREAKNQNCVMPKTEEKVANIALGAVSYTALAPIIIVGMTGFFAMMGINKIRSMIDECRGKSDAEETVEAVAEEGQQNSNEQPPCANSTAQLHEAMNITREANMCASREVNERVEENNEVHHSVQEMSEVLQRDDVRETNSAGLR